MGHHVRTRSNEENSAITELTRSFKKKTLRNILSNMGRVNNQICSFFFFTFLVAASTSSSKREIGQHVAEEGTFFLVCIIKIADERLKINNITEYPITVFDRLHILNVQITSNLGIMITVSKNRVYMLFRGIRVKRSPNGNLLDTFLGYCLQKNTQKNTNNKVLSSLCNSPLSI